MITLKLHEKATYIEATQKSRKHLKHGEIHSRIHVIKPQVRIHDNIEATQKKSRIH